MSARSKHASASNSTKRVSVTRAGQAAVCVVCAVMAQASSALGTEPEQVPPPLAPADMAAPIPESPAASLAPAEPPAAPSPAPVAPDMYTPGEAVALLPLHRGPISLLFGGGLGVFNPTGVNHYMRSWIEQNGTLTQGFPEMYLNVFATVGVQWHPAELFTAEALGEIGLAPKLVSGTYGEAHDFFFWRMSGGILAKLNLVVSRTVNSVSALTLGAGPFLHHMTFEGHAATGPGVRGQIGYVMSLGHMVRPAFFVAFDWARANATNGASTIELSYSGAIFGANLGLDL
jgi:hypothetical protein